MSVDDGNNQIELGGVLTMAVLDELLKNLDSLSDEELAALLSRLEVEKSGRQKENGVVYDNKGQIIACPHCGSATVVKTGHKKGKQTYRCKDCKKYFTETSNTMLHHSRLTEAQWRGLLLGMVQNLSTNQIADTIGVSPKTVWYNSNKVMMLIYDIFHEQDTFIDIAECDEYFSHMSFKGKRNPEFFVYTLGRLPRHHRTYDEKVKYLKEAGLWEELQKNPVFLEQLLSGDTYLAGTNRDSVCILTGKDRSGNLFIKPVCLGSMDARHVIKHFEERFEEDAIIVTDSTNVYNQFAENNNLQHEKILSEKHTNGAFSLSRINALHSILSAYWPDAKENLPATKYLDINLSFFWWLEKSKDLTAQQKVDELYAYLTGKTTIELSYERLRTKHIGLDTKGLIPDHV